MKILVYGLDEPDFDYWDAMDYLQAIKYLHLPFGSSEQEIVDAMEKNGRIAEWVETKKFNIERRILCQ